MFMTDDAALLEISTASDKKVQTILASTPTCSEATTGYRLIDMELISSVFSMLGTLSIMWVK